MADDIKSQAAMMRATSQILEILAPFPPEERINIIAGVVVFSGIQDLILKDKPEIQELLKKVRPRSGQ